jgi:hypothetical protein
LVVLQGREDLGSWDHHHPVLLHARRSIHAEGMEDLERGLLTAALVSASVTPIVVLFIDRYYRRRFSSVYGLHHPLAQRGPRYQHSSSGGQGGLGSDEARTADSPSVCVVPDRPIAPARDPTRGRLPRSDRPQAAQLTISLQRDNDSLARHHSNSRAGSRQQDPRAGAAAAGGLSSPASSTPRSPKPPKGDDGRGVGTTPELMTSRI